ncbi:MAG: DNA-protecting protein DprA [Bacteroidetes bacterium]|nr:DNA-protecting protein DprA [Bacteroidota bacterium]
MKAYSNQLFYQIALTQIVGVGSVIAKNLVAYCGSAESIFKTSRKELLKIPLIGESVANRIIDAQNNSDLFLRVEEELRFIEKEHITPLFFTDTQYPHRLKHCNDAPILLFYQGNVDLNAEKIISVVGTRSATEYGKHQTEKLIKELSSESILVVSGLAYGIDIHAHRAAINNGLSTIGVVAHGLDTLYPSVHHHTAKKMQQQGGLLTEYLSNTIPDKENFPQRNRIVAGMCDAVIVVESKRTGGALITAEIAHTYNKDVFAFSGRAEDELSAGCNMLIKRNKAALIENAADLLYAMNWEQKEQKKKTTTQIPLAINLSEEEMSIVNVLKEIPAIHVDDICSRLNLSPGKASGLLLQLEFSNIIKSLPGKRYTLN